MYTSINSNDLGQPNSGFQQAVQQAILKEIKPFTELPNEHMKPLEIPRKYEAFENQMVKQDDLMLISK